MNLLDENIRQDQGLQLRRWRIRFRPLVAGTALPGIQDDAVIPLLHRLPQPTFFTHDRDYFQRKLVHPAYCLAWLDAFDGDAADFIRRFLRHPRFDSQAKRMGVVARVHADGVNFWQAGRAAQQRANWPAW
jgi:hypothetical protein